MIFFHISAVRAFFAVLSLCVGLSTPPILPHFVVLGPRQQLISQFHGFPATTGSISKGFTLSLEWTVLKPSGGVCGTKIPLSVPVDTTRSSTLTPNIVNQSDWSLEVFVNHFTDNLDVCFIEQPSVCTNTSLERSLDLIPLHSPHDTVFLTTGVWLAVLPNVHTDYSPMAVGYGSSDEPIGVEDGFRQTLHFHLECLTLGLNTMYCSLFVTVLYYLWRQTRVKSKLASELSAAMYNSLSLDLKVSTLHRENLALTEDISTTKAAYELELTSHKLELKEMKEKKFQIEDLLDCTTSSLEDVQADLAQCNLQIEDKQQQRDILVAEKSDLLQKIGDLTHSLEAVEGDNEMLRSEKEDVFCLLTTLQDDHEQVTQELFQLKEQSVRMQAQISSLIKEMTVKEAQLTDQETELVGLRECLNQVTHQTATAQFATLYSSSENNVVECKENRDTLVADVQTVLDDFKMPLDYEQSKQEVNNLRLELDEKESLLKDVFVENESLKQQNMLLKASALASTEQLTTQRLKSQGVTEYLTLKGDRLHRQLCEMERKLRDCKKIESEALSRLVRSEERFEGEKQEWMVAKKQLEEVVQSLTIQVQVNQDRATHAMVNVDSTEQKLRLANKVITGLKMRIAKSQKTGQQQIRKRPVPLSISKTFSAAHSPSQPSPLLQAVSSKNREQSLKEAKEYIPQKGGMISPRTSFNCCLSSNFTTHLQNSQVSDDDSGVPVSGLSTDKMAVTYTQESSSEQEEPIRDILLSYRKLFNLSSS